MASIAAIAAAARTKVTAGLSKREGLSRSEGLSGSEGLSLPAPAAALGRRPPGMDAVLPARARPSASAIRRA
ncbi:MAG: hypothetical protein KKA67_12080 [Spirochaetes bacterium]|nr:hypothetical protein [Spirochaetota bacterium]MBU1080713.1 hypothetical protein [Spirochaetota bacterium]